MSSLVLPLISFADPIPPVLKMKFSLKFLLIVTLVFSACFAWFRWSNMEAKVHDRIVNGDTAMVGRVLKVRPSLITHNQYHSPSALLLTAVETGNYEMVELIAPPIKRSTPDEKHIWNPFSLAVRNGDLDMVQLLLDNGWSPNTNPDFSVLQEAERQGNAALVDLLLKHEANPSSALAWACEQPDPAFASRLLSLGADAKTPNALANAIRAGHEELTQRLLDNGANSALGLFGITDATPRELVDQLIANGDFQAKLDERKLLRNLFTVGDSDILRRVFPNLRCAEVGNVGVDPLTLFVNTSFDVSRPVEKLNVLVEQGAKLTTTPDAYENILVDLAGRKLFSIDDQLGILRVLVTAFPESVNDVWAFEACLMDYGRAPPQLPRLEIAKLFLAAGFQTGTVVDEGQTILHLAANHDKADETMLQILQLLVNAGADVHAHDDRGATPLHRACQNGAVEVVDFLLANGADVNAKTDDGHTPLDLQKFRSSLTQWSRPPLDRLEKVNALLVEAGATEGAPDKLTDQQQAMLDVEKQLSTALRRAAAAGASTPARAVPVGRATGGQVVSDQGETSADP